MRPLYYRRDGTPYPEGDMGFLMLAKDLKKQRKVQRTVLPWGGIVSTIWLGLDHSFTEGRPLIFETMVFRSEKDFSEMDMERYSSEEEAIIGHRKLCEKWFFPQRTGGKEERT